MAVDRSSLIQGLADSFKKDSGEGERIYNTDTQTLLAAGGAKPKADGTIILLEEDEYDKIQRQEKNYTVSKNTGVLPGTNIILREVKGLAATGRESRRTVKSVENSYNCEGIKEGYCIISWGMF